MKHKKLLYKIIRTNNKMYIKNAVKKLFSFNWYLKQVFKSYKRRAFSLKRRAYIY